MGTKVHILSDINPDTKTAHCAECGTESPIRFRPERRSRWYCATSSRGPRVRKPRKADPAVRRQHKLRSAYGLSLDEYAALAASQGGECAICQIPCPSGRQLAVDHCHQTGRIRGLLCNRCNRALGLFRDDAEIVSRAAIYIR